MANIIFNFIGTSPNIISISALLRKTYVECNDQLQRYVHDLAQECDLPFTLNSRYTILKDFILECIIF